MGFDLFKLIYLGDDAACPADFSHFETLRQVLCFKFHYCISQFSSNRKSQLEVREKKEVAW
jgi:hypothetical protein